MAALIFPIGFYINEVGGQPYKLPNNTVVGSSYVLFVLSIFFTIVGLLFAGKVCLPGWGRDPGRLWTQTGGSERFTGFTKTHSRLKIKIDKLWWVAWNMEVSHVSRDRSTMEHLTTKRWKRINEQNTKGGHGHKGVEECKGGQRRLSQHPATVDLKYGRLSVVVLLERVLNVPLPWQPRPQCCCTFLEDHYSHSSTWLATVRPVALRTHLRHHDRSCCYFWPLLATSVVHFFYVIVHFVFFLFFSLHPCRPITEVGRV